ncbi:MAG: ABC transporter permease [Actinomycetota bacterium]|nr:ABC transporter permease [Actinomycetota bacterium]MDK1096294.1 ABC transporter permease [Actinomycetota bacterium]
MLDVNPIVVLGASLVLIAVGVGVSMYLRLGVERSIMWASMRAAVQLIAVGVLLTIVLDSVWELWLAPLWIIAMVGIAAFVVSRRAGTTEVIPAALLAVGGSTALSLAVVFGFGVLPSGPIEMIVIAGITIGNTLPATVVAADQVRTQMTKERIQVEGLLSLGFTARQSARYVVREATRVALLPQIERTKVVGLVALPGAMTGLLLAGVDPIDAVVIQLVVMYLVLGSVAVSATVVAVATAIKSFTPDQRLKAMV